MRVVIQKVKSASVSIEGKKISEIKKGLMILVGVEDKDNEEDIEWLSGKIVNMRIFEDENGVMNRSVIDEEGDILMVSQFTLMASTKKGNRPSYIRASRGEVAKPIFDNICAKTSERLGRDVKKGVFGAMMDVEIINHGPTTIVMDTKNREDW